MSSAAVRRIADSSFAYAALSLFASFAAFVAFVRVGPVVAIFACLLLLSVGSAIASPVGFAVAVLALAPLPAVGEIIGVRVPLGLDPLDILVVLGLGIVAQRQAAGASRWPRALVALTVINLGLILFAWYRTYATEAASSVALGLLVKPSIVIVAAWTVVRLLPPGSIVKTLGLSMGGVLVLVSLSVILQRLGIYTTAHQVAYSSQLGVKQWGGVMLDGNTAGEFVAIFSIPAFLLLRAAGKPRMGVAVAALAVPVLLITLARGSIVAFGASLIALALVDRRRARGLKVALLVGLLGVAWATTGGREQVTFIAQNLTRTAGDSNATLSGRLAIWQVAQQYLDGSGHWIMGGGLDAFKTFASSSALQHGFATHNTVLLLLTTGGVVMIASVAVLGIVLWRVASASSEPALGLALKVALLTAVVVGLSIDVDLFSRRMTWIWVLTAAAASHRGRGEAATAEEHAETIRSDIASTSHGFNGDAISARSSGDCSSST